MKPILSLLCLFTLISLNACFDSAPPEISISKAYSYATSTTQRHGGAFMIITNANSKSDRLINANAPTVAARTELHTHIRLNGNMGMRKVDSMDAQNGLTLEPMGDHIMLMNLKHRLKAGASFPLTLTFEKAGEIKTTVRIVAPGTKP